MVKRIINAAGNFVRDPHYRTNKLAQIGVLNFLSDEAYLKYVYKQRMGKKLDLSNPKTYNEKLQWLKLYDRDPLYPSLVDKIEVKKYVKERIGEEFIIPTLGIWDTFDNIDFQTLPKQFVLKCTHDSGGVVICKDKESFDYAGARRKLNGSLKHNFYYLGREWAYKDVRPRLLAEQYLEDIKTNELRDYKFFCFDGCPKALFIATDRQSEGEETKFDFFDMQFNHLNFTNGHPNSTDMPEKPEKFELMKQLAEKLSLGIPHVRVDFYEANGKVYFGEMTLSHWSGFVPFEPEEWDYTFGSWINLPPKRM